MKATAIPLYDLPVVIHMYVHAYVLSFITMLSKESFILVRNGYSTLCVCSSALYVLFIPCGVWYCSSPLSGDGALISAPLCHCCSRHITEPEIIEEGEVFRRRRYEEESEEERSEEEEVDEEVSPFGGESDVK